MGLGPSSDVERGMERLFGEGTLTGLSDAELLERFVKQRDEGAFEALVTRYGPMILGVCRSRTRRSQTAEDAFQATFLVLVRKARQIHSRESLGGWLYRVAYRIAVRAEAAENLRKRREHDSVQRKEGAVKPSIDPKQLAAVHEEIDRLPERYRTPLVLCHLDGLSAATAAERMGCTEGAVWMRLTRGRERLRGRLARRGLGPACGLIAAESIAEARAVVSTHLCSTTLRICVSAARGTGTVEALATPVVAELCEKAIQNMAWTQWKSVAAYAALAATLTASAAIAVGAMARGRREPAPVETKSSETLAARPAPTQEPRLPEGCEAIDAHPSPDGRRIAFVGSYLPEKGDKLFGLFVVDLGDDKVRQLIKGALKTTTAWSPDSRTLAIGNAEGYGNRYPLFLVNAQTGALEDTGVQGGGPAWSPNGRWIAVSTEFHQGGSWNGGVCVDGRIGLYDTETKKLSPITPPGYNLRDPKTGLSAMRGAVRPVWSPDGERIAFELHTASGERTSRETWIVNRDGSGLRKALPAARPVRWSGDSRDLIAQAEKDQKEERVEVDRLPIVAAADSPQPPAELLAAIRAAEEATARAAKFDPAPVLKRNRLWQNPDLKSPRTVQFIHRMEPTRLDERFVWSNDGTMLLEVVRRDDERRQKEVGRKWVITPDGKRLYFDAGGRYPRVDAIVAAGAAAHARNHLMGTRANFVALDWGRDPASFEINASPTTAERLSWRSRPRTSVSVTR
jgi:RNA polymerase sigma factor (sigma-70 family)